MAFVNTIDRLGDEAVFRSITDRTIAEFKDDKVATIGSFIFYNCSNLKNVVAPSATILGQEVIAHCPSITLVDFGALTYINYNSIHTCELLTAVILRGSTVPNLTNSNIFGKTPIASGTGYIYVPKALIESYKTATNWSIFADVFRALEDYTVDGTITGELDESKI